MAYIVRHDSGFSPNPFGGVCTLACCKPVIRRSAEPGDIVIGTGSAHHGLSGRLIYAIRVGTVLPFQDYWERYKSKRPSPETTVKKRGDNIWHRDAFGNWRGIPGALHDERQRDRDLRGRNALISSEFYYFGRDAIPIPNGFRRAIATARGHKNTYNADLINRFWEWIKRTAPKRGRIGVPVDFSEAVRGVCECNRKAERSDAADSDASFLVARGLRPDTMRRGCSDAVARRRSPNL
jgi:hypothetical protein